MGFLNVQGITLSLVTRMHTRTVQPYFYYYLAIVGIKTEGVVWCCVLTAELDKAPNSTNDVHDSELRPIYSYGTAVMY
eukprot:COSAG01_NODE_904_length_12843_cov_83.351146_4_plen_78_part_00